MSNHDESAKLKFTGKSSTTLRGTVVKAKRLSGPKWWWVLLFAPFANNLVNDAYPYFVKWIKVFWEWVK